MIKSFVFSLLVCCAVRLHADPIFVKVEPKSLAALQEARLDGSVPGLYLKTISDGPRPAAPGTYRLQSLKIAVEDVESHRHFEHTVLPSELRLHFSRLTDRWMFSWPSELIEKVRLQASILGRQGHKVKVMFKYLQQDPTGQWEFELTPERTVEFLRPTVAERIRSCVQSLLLFRGVSHDFRDP